ncbi:hypothetical protein B0H14DRAFT_2646629 [Mycena olivaceomarginata]|nr:hypothetical protein B0H14DRAFT_2646629 [Mycena olivaceomarginata]
MDNYIPASIQTSEQLKHYKHAEAQRRYRERSEPPSRIILKSQSAPGTLKRPVKRRANGCNSYDPEHPARRKLKAEAAEKRYARDADYRESMRKRKFIAKFGRTPSLITMFPSTSFVEPISSQDFASWNMPSNSTRDLGSATVLMMSSPEWDQSRAQSQPLSDPNLHQLWGTGEHDKNPRKYWYLVLNQGVFTKKYGGSGFSPRSIFFSRVTTLGTSGQRTAFGVTLTTATRSLDAEGDGASASSEDDSAPSCARSHQPLGARPPARAPARQTPAGTACAPHPFANGAQGHPSPKARVVARFRAARPGSESHPCQEGVCAAALQGRHPTLRNGGRPCPIVERTPIATPVKTRETPPGFARPRPPACGASSIALPPRPCSTPANGASAPLPRAAALCLPRLGAQHLQRPVPRLSPRAHGWPFLYNETRRKLYKDAKKAMEEMADTDTVQVVDYQDAVRY